MCGEDMANRDNEGLLNPEIASDQNLLIEAKNKGIKTRKSCFLSLYTNVRFNYFKAAVAPEVVAPE
jgi:hypothetical protein